MNYRITEYDAYTHQIYLEEYYTTYYNIGIEEKYFYTYYYDRITSSILIFLNYIKEYKTVAPSVDYVIYYYDYNDDKMYYALVWKSQNVKDFNISNIHVTYINGNFHSIDTCTWNEMKYSSIIEVTEYNNNVKYYKVQK